MVNLIPPLVQPVGPGLNRLRPPAPFVPQQPFQLPQQSGINVPLIAAGLSLLGGGNTGAITGLLSSQRQGQQDAIKLAILQREEARKQAAFQAQQAQAQRVQAEMQAIAEESGDSTLAAFARLGDPAPFTKRLQAMTAPKARILPKEEATESGFAEGTIVQENPDGSFKVLDEPPEILQPGVEEARVRIAQASRDINQQTVNLPAAETEAEKALGRSAGERASGTLAAAEQASESLDRLSLMTRLADEFVAAGGGFGTGAEAKLELSKALQAVGVSPERLGLPADVSSGEALQAEANNLALGKIGGEGGLPANNFSEQDRKFLLTLVPRLPDTEAGFRRKIEIAQRVAERKIEAGARFDELRQGGAKIEEANRTIRKEFRERPLFSDAERTSLQSSVDGPKPRLTTGFGDKSITAGGRTIVPGEIVVQDGRRFQNQNGVMVEVR